MRMPLHRAAFEPLERRRLLSIAPVPRPAWNTGEGFFVADGRVYDANGYEFVIRGFNNNHWWGIEANNLAAVDQFPKTKANAVRAVMGINNSGGSNTPAQRRAIVERYIANNIVPVVEDHEATCSSDPAALQAIVNRWLEPGNVAWLQQYERQVILNIANEWGPVGTAWRDAYQQAITQLRAAGVNNLIMVDAGGCGQSMATLRNWGGEVLGHDPQRNVVFSIHMYNEWREETDPSAGDFSNLQRIRSELEAAQAQGLPIVVGEFSSDEFEPDVYRARHILRTADELGIGWMAWAWNHNTPSTLNMMPGTNYVYNSESDLTPFGDLLINDPVYGIKATSVRASVFGVAAPGLRLSVDRLSTPEGSSATVGVRLSSAPLGPVTVSLARASGSSAIVPQAATLIFTSGNWDLEQFASISSLHDADATADAAVISISSPGLFTTWLDVRQIDDESPVGAFTRNPTDDRDTQNDPNGVNPTINASYWNHIFLRFDLAGIGGKVESARLRLYKSGTTSGRSIRAHLADGDAWTEATGAPGMGPGFASAPLPNGIGWVEVDVTSAVASALREDERLSLAVTVNSNNWTPFHSRQNTNKPQLIVTTSEATPPAVLAAAFDRSLSPHRLRVQFSEDVGASIAPDDLAVAPGAAEGSIHAVSVAYDAASRVATWLFDGVLPEGDYVATLAAGSVADAAGNALASPFQTGFRFLLGDADGNGAVDVADLGLLATHWLQPGRTFEQGDFNYDGLVDVADLGILATRWPTAPGVASTFARRPIGLARSGAGTPWRALEPDAVLASRREHRGGPARRLLIGT